MPHSPPTKTSPVFIPACAIKSQPLESFPNTSNGIVSWKTPLSSDLTPSDSLTAGIATCPADSGYLAHHRHEQAEMYLILKGEGLVRVDGDERRVEKGDAVFIPGNAEHGIRNVGQGDLEWFYCFAADKFGDVGYRFSGSVEKAKL
ncbi:Dimethylsulfonioproprionate lyase DddW [Fulvia fulva]|uniref:Dimethylsulfonioproprionate lyase DddW n=1 Tax=Passalora fulva TaxID=5499 RepID=A0A9Q8UQD5_PASFU|nr:Dimethylsulfonioproprionate lyase DddW [Fulvia fulva]KAK4621769.1 Dimethylsulfonioproprionate lyase DddW [Fulvia fulva]KAK4623247.1 Dimethylsulfonioproprionate lyase DddW [Fulvia fulva]UJO18698.1 Dimethylsulfonioproprionate lyase DddW [Fulvia fulva]WPV16070.1 Dimethylsulfonioproprionate lyase DddW [Fulvia fulva]WPV30634.1 Dimethylsulfonioproprionate lyase DddW [Fulvia fulva]